MDYIRVRETSATILSTSVVEAQVILTAMLTAGISVSGETSAAAQILAALESNMDAQGNVLIGIFPDVFLGAMVLSAKGETTVAPNLVAALTAAIETQGGVVAEIQISALIAAAIEAAGTCGGNPTMVAVTGGAITGVGATSAEPVYVAAMKSTLTALGAARLVPLTVVYLEVVIDATGIVSAIPIKMVFETFTYSGNIPTGSRLVVLTDPMTVELDGVNVRENFDGSFWKIFPGSQDVEYSDEDGSRGVRLTVTRKDRGV